MATGPQVFLEQKKMLKHGLSIAHFRRYIPLIEQETHDYFERWGSSGERGKRAREQARADVEFDP